MAKETNKPRKDSFFNLHFTSTISITLVLYIVGLIAFLFINAHQYTRSTRENMAISVVLNDSINDDQLQRIDHYLSKISSVKKYQLITSEMALKEYTETMGTNPENLLGVNPLHASYEVFMNADYTNENTIKEFSSKIKSFEGISEVFYQSSILQLLETNVNRLLWIFAIIAGILIFISIVLINNTVRISIYSKRFLINTMKLVGATPYFISKPFLGRALKNSIIAGFFATLLLALTAFYFINKLGISIQLIDLNVIIPILGSLFGLSILINEMATLIGVRHYIRMKSNNLYYI